MDRHQLTSIKGQSHNSIHHNKTRNTTAIDLYPVALRAIEEDDPDKMKTLIELESFNKDSIDILLEKVCERSHDISLEEELVRNSSNITDTDEERSMLSVCQTNRKNNEQLFNLLLEAETKAEIVASQSKQTASNNNKKHSPLNTPTKPVLKSVEKDPNFLITPETPEFKPPNVKRQLKFS